MATKQGRPSAFTSKLADVICERLAVGQSLKEVCRDDEMPASSTVFKWLAEKKEFSDQYVRAKEAGVEALAEEMLDIADDGTNDWMERRGKDDEPIGWMVNGEAIGRSKVRIDTRKWLLSKLAPKKYGDKLQHTGADGEGPVEVVVSDLEFARRTAFMLAKGVKQDKKD